MEIRTALQLIENGIPRTPVPQRWLELGAGEGLFTSALSDLLPSGSTIVTVDQKSLALEYAVNRNVNIEQIVGDFTVLDFSECDGILMANSLHFVAEKEVFFPKLKGSLKKNGTVIIVEYDTDVPNRWIPYPISFRTLTKRFEDYHAEVQKLGQVSSLYQASGIYSVQITFGDSQR